MGWLYTMIAALMVRFIALLLSGQDDAAQKRIEKKATEFNDLLESQKTEFIEKYAVPDRVIQSAIRQEKEKSELAKEIEKRLIEEIDFDKNRYQFNTMKFGHFVALGILAQEGKVPYCFIADGINCAYNVRPTSKVYLSEDLEECSEMMKRFIRWYDNELVFHGFPERLVQKRDNVPYISIFDDQDKSLIVTPIQEIDENRLARVMFWWSARKGIHGELGGRDFWHIYKSSSQQC